MAKTKVGTMVYWRKSSPVLVVFRLMPETGSKFPPYKAGQYIALARNDCRLTKKIIKPDKTVECVPLLDANGNQKRGIVTHSYSIASAPFETLENGFLEFYVILEQDDRGNPGRLTESLFRMDPEGDNELPYFDKITGEFTLERRAGGFKNVVLVGTGTGLAPFVSEIKQLHYEACRGRNDGVRYTLIHANRTYEELDYREQLSAIEASQKFDFLYLPSVSRPTQRDLSDSTLGKGRGNNVLRRLLGMPTREEQDLEEAQKSGGDVSRAKATLDRTVMPVLADKVSARALERRLYPASETVILTCGNPSSMADIKYVADTNHVRFEKEDW